MPKRKQVVGSKKVGSKKIDEKWEKTEEIHK